MPERQQVNNAPTIVISVVVILIFAAAAVYLYYQNTLISSQLSAVQKSNESLTSSLNNTQNNLNLAIANYASVNQKYKSVLANLTTPYVRVIANGKTINLPAAAYNYTSSQWQYKSYNFTFNAPYSGYLIFNSTSTILNSFFGSSWSLFISQEKPYLSNGTLELNRYISAYSGISPSQNSDYVIPIQNGTNYIIITNYNSTGIQITYSLKYFGIYNKYQK